MNQRLATGQRLVASGTGPLAGRFVDARTGAPSTMNFTGRVDAINVATLGTPGAGAAR